jgi:hypothetical protein
MYLLILSIALNIAFAFVSGYAQQDITLPKIQLMTRDLLPLDSLPQATLKLQNTLLTIPPQLHSLSLIKETDIEEATQLIRELIIAAALTLMQHDVTMTAFYNALVKYNYFIKRCAIARYEEMNPNPNPNPKYLDNPYRNDYVYFLMSTLLIDQNLELENLLWQEQRSVSLKSIVADTSFKNWLDTAKEYLAPTIIRSLPPSQK